MAEIKPRERTAIIQSLKAGVVPKIGLHHIQVGRKKEIEAILQDLKNIEDGSAAVRFIIGRFGSGKTFFLNLSRAMSLEQKFVVVQADITTERRLHASGGQARALYSELIRNMATKTKPEGGALQAIIEKWISGIEYDVKEMRGGSDDDVEKHIFKQLEKLQDLVNGYDFAMVINQYYRAHKTHNEQLQQFAIRWLRAEYSTKTEARQDLNVRNIIDDAQVYDYLKLMAHFVKIAGYKGLIVNIDEMVVLSHRLANTQARNSNYEAILRIVNDSLQGNSSYIGFLFGGTDEFLEDKRRGLYSYEALATRLAQNTFATNTNMQDFSSPVIKLQNLSQEDLFVLLHNIRNVFACGDSTKHLVPEEGLTAFMSYCYQTLGAAYFATPRDVIKKFVDFLGIIEQNPSCIWSELLNIKSKNYIGVPTVTKDDISILNDSDDDLVTLKL